MKLLETISAGEIENGRFPLDELLENSLYYPAAETDGGVVKHFAKEVQSFVFCDYSTGEAGLLESIDGFWGYRVLGNRTVRMEELIPAGWSPLQVPRGVDRQSYFRHAERIKTPFAHWVVFERTDKYGEAHGPRRFSLLYIGGEAVATYHALYLSNKKSAKIVAIIQPGTGFGGNWTDFRRKDAPLAQVVLQNPCGTPDKVLYGGRMNDADAYTDLSWDGYNLTTTITPYYRCENQPGKVTVWERKEINFAKQPLIME